MELLREIHGALQLVNPPAERAPDEINQLNSLLSSILHMQAQQIELLRGLSERVGRMTPR